jgi:predicted TIM-barrel fold metal-dependent hydrolase
VRLIALEEAWSTSEFLDGPGQGREYAPRIAEQLSEVSGARISEMDRAGIDLQVLSLVVPGTEQLKPGEAVATARDTNDSLAGLIAAHPDRFAGFAALPTPSPRHAEEELTRVLDDLEGFVGVIINGHSHGRYLDDPAFAPLLSAIADRGVPIYLHPTPSPKPVVDAWFGDLPPATRRALSRAAWGWHVETGTHLLRLITGGVFDAHPDLQVIVGHMGELVPFMMPRYDRLLAPEITGTRHAPSKYLCENVSYTFAGFNWLPTFQLLKNQVPVERIMFSVDYPFGSNESARAFFDDLDLTERERELIAHENAERLLAI